MKFIVKSLKLLVLLSGLAITLYALEMAIYPKQTIELSPKSVKFRNSEFLDVNYKLRASKYAIGKNKDSNGWYVSENAPKKINNKFAKKGLLLQVKEQEFMLIDSSFLANKLYLVNGTNTKYCFSAQDSRLNIKMQAKNLFGVWQDIEYIPESWCGNSYHEICLDKGEYWEFPSFQFKGRHKTKFRYKLINGKEDIYSNEIKGYVNNGQFLNKQIFFSLNLMSPYNE